MHTPGKWEWSSGDPTKRNYGIYSVEGGRIAEVLNQSEANARLIAAAPELLAACVEAIHTFEIEVPHGNPTIAALKAAIAKATA